MLRWVPEFGWLGRGGWWRLEGFDAVLGFEFGVFGVFGKRGLRRVFLAAHPSPIHEVETETEAICRKNHQEEVSFLQLYSPSSQTRPTP